LSKADVIDPADNEKSAYNCSGDNAEQHHYLAGCHAADKVADVLEDLFKLIHSNSYLFAVSVIHDRL